MKKIFTVPNLYVWLAFTIVWFVMGDYKVAIGSIYGAIMIFAVFVQLDMRKY